MARDPTRSTAARQGDPAGSTAAGGNHPAGSTATPPGDRAGSIDAGKWAQWTVLYDADCGFCRWSLAQVLALDRARRLRPLALGTDEADRLLADLPPDLRAASWHLVSPDGRRESAGAAGAALLSLFPAGRVPSALLRRAPAFTERAYRWVADHRSLLSRAIPAGAKGRATARIERHGIRPQAASSDGSFAAR